MAARIATALLGVLASLVSMASVGAAQTSIEEKAVMEAVQRLMAAYQERDVKTYEALTTPDFVRVTPNGRRFERAAWLKTVAAPGEARPFPKVEQLSVVVYGNAALVTSRNIPPVTATDPGVPILLTRVMVKEGNQWKLAYTQSTDARMPAPPSGPEPAAPAAWSPSTPGEREALAAFAAIQKANRESNVAAWEKLSAPEHRIINTDGSTMSRAERVAEIKTTPPDPSGFKGEQELHVTVKGDVALVTSRDSASRSLKVMARQHGAWQQVLQQFSPIVPAR